MKLIYVKAVIAGVCLSVAGCADKADEGQNYLIIENATAIDAVHGVREQVDVIVVDDKIKAVGAEAASDLSAAQRSRAITIDATGKYVLPGLWDAHVHLTFTPGIDYRTFFPLSLAHGVTSLRDTGGHLEALAPAIAAADSDDITPDLYVSGPLLDGPLRVYDGGSPSFPDISIGVSSPAEAERIVDELAAAGVDLVKAYEMLSPEVFSAILARAESHGLPVAAHTPLSMSATQAAQAGASDMQHLRNLEFDCAEDPSGLLAVRREMLTANDAPSPGALRGAIHRSQRAAALGQQNEDACEALVATLAAAGGFQTPTLVIVRFLINRHFEKEAWRETYNLMPAEIAQGWRERSDRLSGFNADDLAIAHDNWIKDMIVRLQNGGVPIMAGTDAPIAFLTPGASLHEELALLVDAGLTPIDAIAAATHTPASFFGLEDELGAVYPGMNADLVLLHANPLDDIRHVAAIEAVVKSGHLLDRAALDALLTAPASLED